jgi:hypothetical protein
VLSDSTLALRTGSGFRRPDWYASSDDDAYWLLMHRFEHPSSPSAVWPDRLTGWIRGIIVPGTRAHVEEPGLGERTAVLLYGDSFAEGVHGRPYSFEGLMETSPLQATHALINYGVGGYGADQVLLLARATLPRFEARKPVVILSLLVDDDLDRAVLGFRGGPKPRFHVEHGVLVEPQPVETNLALYLEQHPLGIRSYLLQLFCRAPGLLPGGLQSWLRGDETRLAEKQALAEALVRAICRELRAHAGRSTLLLMRARPSVLDPRHSGWQEDTIRRVAAEEGVPVLDSRDVLLRALDGDLARLDNLYEVEGAGVGHWNVEGNLVVFQQMRAFAEASPPEKALEYVDELLRSGVLAGPGVRSLEAAALGGELFVHYRESSDALCFIQSHETPGRASDWYLGLRAGDQGASSLRWCFPAPARRLTARLRTTPGSAALQSVREVILRVRRPLDAEHTAEERIALPVGAASREWTVEFEGGELELAVDPPPGGGRSPWVLIEKARLE